MPIIVDGLDGEIHRAYGTLPNMVYVVDQEGRIVYRSQWTLPQEIRDVLGELAKMDERRTRGERVSLGYSERLSLRDTYQEAHRRVFDRAGSKAQRDLDAVFGRSR